LRGLWPECGAYWPTEVIEQIPLLQKLSEPETERSLSA
jgi:hypothetical protein